MPDWKDPKKYRDAKKTQLAQWAWEFLRRNPQYQQFFAENNGQELSAAAWNRLWDDFRICRLHDPATDYNEEIRLDLIALCVPESAFCHPIDDKNDGDTNSMIATQTGEIIFKFNVNLPIPQQFEYAQKRAVAHAKWLAKQEPPAPLVLEDEPDYEFTFSEPENYGSYATKKEYQMQLRILDAEADASVSPDKLIATIAPADDPAKHHDPESIRRTWRSRRKQAKKMRDSGYKLLPTGELTSAPPEKLEQRLSERKQLQIRLSHPIKTLQEQLKQDD